MALTRNDFTGDGVKTVYDVSFSLGFLQESDIYVSLDTNEHTTQLSYTFLNATQITLASPVTNGVGFNIRRVVDRTQPINDFQAGAILREKNLDDSYAQALMIVEEIEDGYMTAVPTWVVQSLKMNDDLDMGGFKITNLAAPTEVTDAVNKQTTDDIALRVSSLESNLGTSAGAIILVYDYTSIGGETTLDVPYTLVVVHSVTINGIRQIRSTVTSDGAWELALGVINIAEPLEVGDTVSVDIVEIS